MGLAEYRRKRHFRRTSEPKGKTSHKTGWLYVIQKHAARNLHYDLRLELDGVLKSWAVPKGPSLDPKQKRLAMQVEDHPVEYGDFEGIIPEGEYGGGTVMLWDRGHWEPIDDPHEGYRQGKLKFRLHGAKLKGAWVLVRTGASSRSGDARRTWLLMKQPDDHAQPLAEGDILDREAQSVASGRDLGEIAADRDRIWGINGSPKRNAKARKQPSQRSKTTPKVAAVDELTGVTAGKLPASIRPQLATLTQEAPEGDKWLHEIKLDGYRMLCRIDQGKVRFISRNQQDWTERFAFLERSAKKLPVKQALLDGEVVALQADGTTDFQALQNAFRKRRVQELVYFVFDLLHLDGRDLTAAPLEERKRVLADLLASTAGAGSFRFTDHVAGQGPEFFRQACKLGLEGILSKRRDRPYSPGRGYDWLKVKCVKKDEFVIGGYTEPGGSRTGFGALLVGYHDGDEDLVYAGKVGTGFDQRALRDLLARLKPLERDQSPFASRQSADLPRRAHWVAPRLVAQVAYGNWTRDGLLRHPSFQGLREDKSATEVVRDKPLPVEEAVSKAQSKSPSRRGTSGARSRTPQRKAAVAGGRAEPSASQEEFRGVRLTSPDKVLYPQQGITKLELARFYVEIADWVLPHMADRPLVLVRCPEGQDKKCFYQKHPRIGTPKNLRQIPVREKDQTENYLVVDDVGGLISLVQIGSLEIHAWGSRADDIERPDRLIFDLDPDPSVAWPQVVESARQIRQFLDDLGLESFVKTTGGKGLHVVVPIQRRHNWDEAKEFCKALAEAVVTADPKRYTSNMSKAARPGKIFIDYLRNGRGATSIVPYSTRAKASAPVSTPLAWEELSPRVPSDQFNVRNLAERLAALKRDPWKGISAVRQSLTAAMKKKLGL